MPLPDESDGAMMSFSATSRKPALRHYPLCGTLVGFTILPEVVDLDEIDVKLKEAYGKDHGTI